MRFNSRTIFVVLFWVAFSLFVYSFQPLLQVWPEQLLRNHLFSFQKLWNSTQTAGVTTFFIHLSLLLTNVIKLGTFSIFNVDLFYHLQIKYYKVTSLLRLSTLVPDSIQYVKFCPSVPRRFTMSCLSIVAQLDGFQHAADAFFFKALALVDLRTGFYQMRRFDSTDLLSHSRDHVLTYRVQVSGMVGIWTPPGFHSARRKRPC